MESAQNPNKRKKKQTNRALSIHCNAIESDDYDDEQNCIAN